LKVHLPPVLTRALPRSTVVLGLVLSGILVWREGGGADARLPLPSLGAASQGTGPPDPGRGAEAYEVVARLVERLPEARLDVPGLSAAESTLQPYWRKMRVPWKHLSGLSGRLAMSLAMRTSRDPETQWTVPVQGGDTWIPDARVWNMNEGSFEQREAIFAPAPATVAFRLDLPPHARLRTAPALLAPMASTTLFEVTLVDAAGIQHALSRTRLTGFDAKHWTDVDVDLSPWGGQKVELRLRTSSERPELDERKWGPSSSEGASTGSPARRGEPGEPDPGTAESIPASAMALAFWGDPVVVARQPTRVPYDVLWIVVDALRPDVAASMHDAAEDAAELASPHPPLDARLPAVPGLMPAIDGLAGRGVRFTHAWSAGTWTRPGTLAMLTGERSSELGIDTREWVLPAGQVSRYYGAEPPLVPLILRRNGVETAAFVNNFFMAGYVPVGLDMGFERVTDHRYRVRDTAEITRDALAWLDGHASSRFFLFVNYNSPHEPYDPPGEMLARVPPPPRGPQDRQVRAYMGEGAKDDAAIGILLGKLDALGLARSTLVVVTSDHGETLSSAHQGFGADHMLMRFHHAAGNFEETARIPLVMALPGVLDGGHAVSARVRNIDIAPTLLALEGLEADPRMSGKSMLPLARGQKEAEPRVVVTEGRGSRSILWGPWHLVVHDAGDANDELYDRDQDPGERRNVARSDPDDVAVMKARLTAALANVRTADAPPDAPAALPVVHVRFAGAGGAHHVTGAFHVGDGKHGASLLVEPVGVPREAIRVDGPLADVAFDTGADGLVGLDLRVDPPGAAVTWKLVLDDAPWPAGATFAGPFGLPAVAALAGIASDEARAEVYAAALPLVDPSRDLGVFVTRDKPGDASADGGGLASGGEGAKEMQRMLQQWGYAHGSH
jgi:arylsulfatase A-like enzyme